MNQNEHDDVTRLLKKWDASVSVPDTFRSSVWSRIAARQEERDQSLWRQVVYCIKEACARPVIASAGIAFALSLGLAAAGIHSSSIARRAEAAAEADYLGIISPLFQSTAHGHDSNRTTN